ncbi:MAG: ABC transporter ATP-binding protein, partial [Gammaproteobacteria bacterium]
YHALGARVADGDAGAMVDLGRLQHELETAGGWGIDQRVETVLSRVSLDGDADFAALSGGVKRRAMLARALVQEPDLLLLDEPTNHLDVTSIDWLEGFLASYAGTVLFVSHDRAFARRLATRVVEMDRGVLTSWPGDFDVYLRRKAEMLETEARQSAKFDRKLAQEEAWIRQGIKARRTRNEGRVRALEKMREERRARRARMGKANLRLADAIPSGRLVAEVQDVSYAWEDQPIVRDLSTIILRGDRVGVIGPNGCGKSTLLQLLLGQLPPDSGRVRLGTRLEVAYYDQLRESLDPAATVRDTVGGGSDQVEMGGRSRHIMSYLQDFLFSAERARSPVSSLSGGERNRLMLARLFLRPANLLVMDEPTNDLDVETLELLEELLQKFEGTLLLVSHDRAFLDNVVTSTLVFEGDARVAEYAGGYQDWLRQRPAAATPEAKPASRQAAPVRERKVPGRRKLSHKEQRELKSVPGLIEKLEAERESLHAKMTDPEFYRGESTAIAEAKSRLDAVEAELKQAYARWEALEQ